MRGVDEKRSSEVFTASPESLVPKDHPLRLIKAMADAALIAMSPKFKDAYSVFGRPSIPPERLLRALLLQILYSVRSERMLIEQLQYNMLFRWFVGMSGTEPIWNPTTYSKNRDRFLEGEVAVATSARCSTRPEPRVWSARSTSAWTARSSRPGPAEGQGRQRRPPAATGGPWQPGARLEGREALQCHAPVEHGPGRPDVQEVQGLANPHGLPGPRPDGEPQRAGLRGHLVVLNI